MVPREISGEEDQCKKLKNNMRQGLSGVFLNEGRGTAEGELVRRRLPAAWAENDANENQEGGSSQTRRKRCELGSLGRIRSRGGQRRDPRNAQAMQPRPRPGIGGGWDLAGRGALENAWQ